MSASFFALKPIVALTSFPHWYIRFERQKERRNNHMDAENYNKTIYFETETHHVFLVLNDLYKSDFIQK